MHMQDLIGGIEAILFASANPMTESDLKKVVHRWVASLPPEADALADAAASPLQLDAIETQSDSQAGAGEPDASCATVDDEEAAGEVCADEQPGVQASEGADEVTPEPEPQADGDLKEPVAISEEELEAAGSDAAPKLDDADAGEDEDEDKADAASEDAIETGRLTLDTPLPKVAAAAEGDETALAAAAEALAPGADGQHAAETPEQASADETLVAASAADEEAQQGVATAEPCLSPSPAQARFDWRKNFKAAMAAVKARWQDPPEYCGFTLVEVADALTFRSNPRFAPVLLAMRDEKPPKLSRAAMETLAIIAYRQPVTKPESDHIRGVDCGGTIKMLLDRNLIRIVGKKEEPGRPLLYGTGPEFLSFFNLASVHHLPSLRAFDELNDDSEDALRELDALPSLQELSAQAKQFRLDDEPAMGSLDAAVDALRRTESTSRDALAAQGITLAGDEDDKAPAAPAPTQH